VQEDLLPPPATCLAVAVQLQGIVALPDGASAATLGLVVQVTLANTAIGATGCGQTAQLAVLVDGLADPVDAGIASHGLVRGVDQNDLVELVGRVLAHPVRVEHTESTALPANTLLTRWLNKKYEPEYKAQTKHSYRIDLSKRTQLL
jgi:hypothetical protein